MLEKIKCEQIHHLSTLQCGECVFRLALAHAHTDSLDTKCKPFSIAVDLKAKRKKNRQQKTYAMETTREIFNAPLDLFLNANRYHSWTGHRNNRCCGTIICWMGWIDFLWLPSADLLDYFSMKECINLIHGIEKTVGIHEYCLGARRSPKLSKHFFFVFSM